jgi:Protein of unknown function (DUF1580)
LIRAITKGVNGHKLEALRVGSRWLTSIQAIQRWLELQTHGPGTATGTSATGRGKAAELAERELDRLGC